MISAFFTWNDLHMKVYISTCQEDSRTTRKSQIHKEAVQMGDNSCNNLLSKYKNGWLLDSYTISNGNGQINLQSKCLLKCLNTLII